MKQKSIYLSQKEIDQRKLRDATKNVNAVIRHIETDDITQTNKLAITQPFGLRKKLG